MRRQIAMAQIHQQEGQVVPHVHARDGVAEFNRVEEPGLAVQHHHVAEVQVSVAASHPASNAALLEQGRMLIERTAALLRDVQTLTTVEDARQFVEITIVAVDDPSHAGLATFRGRRFARGVQRVHGLGQRPHHRQRQSAARGQRVEQLAVVEAAHHDQPVDGRSSAVHGQRAIRLPGHGRHPQVEVGGGAPIDRKLRLARLSPEIGCGVIEILEAHRALQLVGVLWGEEHHGGVGVAPLDRVRSVQAPGGAQERQRLGLSVDDGHVANSIPPGAGPAEGHRHPTQTVVCQRFAGMVSAARAARPEGSVARSGLRARAGR